MTAKEDEVVKLEGLQPSGDFSGGLWDFCLLTVMGKQLLKLLERNLPLYDGYIYYGGEKVNTWKEHYKAANRISIIQRKVLWQGI